MINRGDSLDDGVIHLQEGGAMNRKPSWKQGKEEREVSGRWGCQAP